jgi:hypothetical protein
MKDVEDGNTTTTICQELPPHYVTLKGNIVLPHLTKLNCGDGL